jgi:hypothetical protein
MSEQVSSEAKPQRKKAVTSVSSIVYIVARFPLPTGNHPRLAMAWLGLLMSLPVIGLFEVVKLNKRGR